MHSTTRLTLLCASTILALAVGQSAQAQATQPQATDEGAKQTSEPSAVSTLVTQARARWIASCWTTANLASRKEGSYLAVLAFDGNGKLLISGISEVRGSSDPGIAQCLRRLSNDFRIPATGVPSSSEVPFDIP